MLPLIKNPRVSLQESSFLPDPPCKCLEDLELIDSYRIAIWTRSAPDLSQPDTEALKAKILAMGRFFKGDVLGYNDTTNKIVAGTLMSEVTFESHRVSLKMICGRDDG